MNEEDNNYGVFREPERNLTRLLAAPKILENSVVCTRCNISAETFVFNIAMFFLDKEMNYDLFLNWHCN